MDAVGALVSYRRDDFDTEKDERLCAPSPPQSNFVTWKVLACHAAMLAHGDEQAPRKGHPRAVVVAPNRGSVSLCPRICLPAFSDAPLGRPLEGTRPPGTPPEESAASSHRTPRGRDRRHDPRHGGGIRGTPAGRGGEVRRHPKRACRNVFECPILRTSPTLWRFGQCLPSRSFSARSAIRRRMSSANARSRGGSWAPNRDSASVDAAALGASTSPSR